MKPDPTDPSFMGALIYFNEAADKLSFALAADALGVTPSAVSHRIAALEVALGQRLFQRETRRVRLTPEGSRLAQVTRETMGKLRKVADRLANEQVLRVSVGPYLSSMWLMARLKDFERPYPGLRVDLDHVIGSASTRDVDVSILWEDAVPQAAGHRSLFDTTSVPVAAPGLIDVASFWETELPPIHYRDRQPWRHWLQAAGAPLSYADEGDVLDDPNLVFEATAHGRGISIGFLPFISEMFVNGRLTAVSDVVVASQRVYRVVVRKPEHPHSIRFAEWLIDQAQKTVAATTPY